MHDPQFFSSRVVRFERPQRHDENAGSGVRADPAAAPALLDGPYLPRLLPAEHMPETRARRRGDAADHLDRAPHRCARRLDARTRRRLVRTRAELGDAQMRGIEGAQRVELRHGKAGAEILACLAHGRCDRAAALHDLERVDGAVGPGQTAETVGNGPRRGLDRAVLEPLPGRAEIAALLAVPGTLYDPLWHISSCGNIT